MEAEEFFRAEWPAVARRISQSLARRGVHHHDREDLLQETAARLYRSWDQVDPTRPVEPYARVVAYNVWRDALRRGGHEEPVDVVPELAAPADDVERICLARDEIGRVGRAWRAFRPEQREVLRTLAAEELDWHRPEVAATDRVRMARMRARRQLRAVLETASGLVAVLAALRHLRPRAVPVATVSVAVAAGLFLLLPSRSTPAESAVPRVDAATESVRDHLSEVTRSRVAPATARPAPRVAATRRAPAKRPVAVPDYYWLPAGPAEVGVRLEVDVMGHGVAVRGSETAVPVCVRGTVTTLVDPAYDCGDD